MDNIVRALKKIRLFKDVSDPGLKLVAEAAEKVSFGAGEKIVSETDTAKALLLIRNGTVRVSREGVPPLTFGAGQAIGQLALLDGGPIGLTAVAIERVDAFAIRPQKLAEKLSGNYEVGFQIYRAVARSLAARLRWAVDELTLASERLDRS
jgi:CRP-like cAMP-binding protein